MLAPARAVAYAWRKAYGAQTVAEQNVVEWLEAWIEENIQASGYHENKAHMKIDAAQCREQAKTEGISELALIEAAGGDLEAYLLREQNAFTDAEVRRQADKDD